MGRQLPKSLPPTKSSPFEIFGRPLSHRRQPNRVQTGRIDQFEQANPNKKLTFPRCTANERLPRGSLQER